MADPLRKPSEPDFSVEPFAEPALPENTADVGELERRDQGQKLVDTAESVGSTLGGAVGNIRKKLHSGLEVVRKKRSGTKSGGEEGFTGEVRYRANQVKEQASRRIQRWSSTAQHRFRTLRARTQEFSRERPVELILTIGGICMVAGAILRLWRSDRD